MTGCNFVHLCSSTRLSTLFQCTSDHAGDAEHKESDQSSVSCFAAEDEFYVIQLKSEMTPV